MMQMEIRISMAHKTWIPILSEMIRCKLACWKSLFNSRFTEHLFLWLIFASPKVCVHLFLFLFLELLLESGSDLTVSDNDKNTPLHHACLHVSAAATFSPFLLLPVLYCLHSIWLMLSHNICMYCPLLQFVFLEGGGGLSLFPSLVFTLLKLHSQCAFPFPCSTVLWVFLPVATAEQLAHGIYHSKVIGLCVERQSPFNACHVSDSM